MGSELVLLILRLLFIRFRLTALFCFLQTKEHARTRARQNEYAAHCDQRNAPGGKAFFFGLLYGRRRHSRLFFKRNFENVIPRAENRRIFAVRFRHGYAV